jgi:excisionase family DNA binding protein
MSVLADKRLTLTIEEAGELLGVGRSTAYAAARAGQLPVVRIGRRLLVPRHKLEELLGAVHNASSPADEPGLTKTSDHGAHDQAYTE